MLTLLGSGASPFVRKVLVAAQELGLAAQVTVLERSANPVDRDARIFEMNPLGRVPAARTDDGILLYDSRVVCEWLDDRAGGGILFPAPGPARWAALTRQSLADGLLEAALAIRYEQLFRPADLHWPLWLERQGEKITAALDTMAADPPAPAARDIGTISCACAIAWLDLRRADLDWRATRPRLAAWFDAYRQRPAMIATHRS